jgi:hypothetical protein
MHTSYAYTQAKSGQLPKYVSHVFIDLSQSIWRGRSLERGLAYRHYDRKCSDFLVTKY